MGASFLIFLISPFGMRMHRKSLFFGFIGKLESDNRRMRFNEPRRLPYSPRFSDERFIRNDGVKNGSQSDHLGD